MGKTRDLFKKVRGIKGKFHGRISVMKDRNGKDIRKCKRLRRDGKNTQKNHPKKAFNDLDNHDGVVTLLE